MVVVVVVSVVDLVRFGVVVEVNGGNDDVEKNEERGWR